MPHSATLLQPLLLTLSLRDHDNRLHYRSCPFSIRLSILHVWVSISKQKRRETKIGLNLPRDGSKHGCLFSVQNIADIGHGMPKTSRIWHTSV